jgi:hypothetical protein
VQERIEKLISEHLPQKLEILSEKELTLALDSFVHKVRSRFVQNVRFSAKDPL